MQDFLPLGLLARAGFGRFVGDDYAAAARDLVEAQNGLTRAKISLTNALVTHTIARLEFWLDMGILFIKDNGQWEEYENEKRS